MIVKTKRFEAYYSLTFNQWTVTTDEFSVIVKTLRINYKAQKKQYQIIKGTNIRFNLIDSQILIIEGNLEKKKLWDWNDPDKPRNLAKSVTV